MRLILTVLALMLSSVSSAYDYSGKFGVGGNAGYNFPVFGNPFNKAADADWTWGIHGRYHFNTKWGVEAGYTRHDLSDTTIAAQVFDGLAFYRFNGAARFTPVAGIGVGIVDLSNYDPGNLKLGLKARVGAEYAFSECLSGAFNIDYQRVDKMLFSDNLPGRVAHIIAHRVALTWYFGAQKKHAHHPRHKTAPAVMTPVDSDNDGVPDDIDRCMNTIAGVEVNHYGCAKEEKAEINVNVEFASGQAMVAPQYRSQLEDLAKFLKENSGTTVVIEGHTDNSGSVALNTKLSFDRAEAVKNYLIQEFGIDSRRLSAQGFGPTKPVADNNTVSGKQKNRRVIAVVSE